MSETEPVSLFMSETEPWVTVGMALEYVDQCNVPMDEFIHICGELDQQAQLVAREPNQREREKMIEASFLHRLLGSVSCGLVQGSDDQDKFEPG